MLLGLGLMPVTRITDHTSSLIDHIYTNTSEKRSDPESALPTFVITFQYFVIWLALYLLLMNQGIFEISHTSTKASFFKTKLLSTSKA